MRIVYRVAPAAPSWAMALADAQKRARPCLHGSAPIGVRLRMEGLLCIAVLRWSTHSGSLDWSTHLRKARYCEVVPLTPQVSANT